LEFVKIRQPDQSKNYEQLLMKFHGGAGHDPRKKWSYFGGDPTF